MKHKSTNFRMSVALEKQYRIKSREIALFRLPAPLGDITSVQFIVGNATPTLEYLLTSIIIPCSSLRIVDPNSIREITWYGSLRLTHFQGPMIRKRDSTLTGGSEE